jgi:hypothetical protein
VFACCGLLKLLLSLLLLLLSLLSMFAFCTAPPVKWLRHAGVGIEVPQSERQHPLDDLVLVVLIILIVLPVLILVKLLAK